MKPTPSTYIVLLALAAASLTIPSARAAGAARNAGVAFFAGYQTYAMDDVNRAMADPGAFFPGATGTGEAIRGGPAGGLGIRWWFGENTMLALDGTLLVGSGEAEIVYFGSPYRATVSVDAISATLTLGYFFARVSRVNFGIGAGSGYYSSIGTVSTETFASGQDLDGSGIGFHGLALADLPVSETFHLDLGVGYRYARTSDVEIGGSVQQNPDGSDAQIDWSGLMTRIGFSLLPRPR